VELKQWCAFALAGALIGSSALGLTISGRVFVDGDEDGVAGAAERGLAKVAVSDGREVVLTSKSGAYELETEAGRFVFVSVPRGYRAVKSFYANAEAGKAADFPLAEWPESRPSTVRFVQITDIHVTGKADTVSTFVEDIEEINALQPAAVFAMATGDLVNVGKNPLEYDNYLQGISRFRLPLFNLPGNHDAMGAEAMAHYHRYLGPEYYSFNVGNCHFMMLNCLSFDEQQKVWIEKDLAVAPRGATRIFALHFLPTQEQVEYLARYGAAAVLSGHWHGNRVRESHGVLDMNTPPLRFGGIDRHPRSFRIVDVKRGRVNNELRLGGFKHHAVVVAPNGPCEVRSGKLPVVVNAYDTRYEVAAVEVEACGRRVSLKRAGPWSWTGALRLPNGLAGDQRLVARVRASGGATWQTEGRFQVEGAPGTSGEAESPLRLKWAAPTGGFIGLSSPRTGMKSVAVGIDDTGDLKNCGVSAFATDGKRLWHFATDSAVKNNIAAAGGRLFATCVAGWLYALDETSGKLVWKAELDRQRERWEVAGTTVAEGIVHVGAHSYIAAFDAQTGRLLWEKRHGKSDWWPSCYTLPTVARGKLVLATRSGAYALEARSGQELWKQSGAFNGCLIAQDIIYTLRGNELAALRLDNGDVLWSTKAKVGDTASAPALAGDRLVVGTADGRVCAFSPQDGTLLWTAQTGASLTSLQPYQRGGSDVNSSPAISGDTVYFGASDGEVHALSLHDGAKRGSYRLGVPIASSPLIVDRTLYIGGYDGILYGFAIHR
jgi:outer membrane protein assembly factor BamB/predicted MPP superfamily phosphohydrolase